MLYKATDETSQFLGFAVFLLLVGTRVGIALVHIVSRCQIEKNHRAGKINWPLQDKKDTVGTDIREEVCSDHCQHYLHG